VSERREEIGVIQFGLGPIGLETLRRALRWRGLRVVGCVEARQREGEKAVAALVEELGVAPVPVADSLANLGKATEAAKVALHTAVSSLERAVPQIEELVAAGLDVITTAEEAICPTPSARDLATRLDRAAKKAGVAVFPAGVNPGFLMDRLVVFLTSVCHGIEEVEVERVVDCSTRRARLQEKLGVGGEPAAIRERIEKGEAGHVGLEESLRFVATELGLSLQRVTVKIEPVVATDHVRRNGLSLRPGQVAGIYHEAIGIGGGKPVISMKLRMAADRDEAFDRIVIRGTPPVSVRFEGGLAGDQATVACVLNAIPYVLELPPGFAASPPIPHYWDAWGEAP